MILGGHTHDGLPRPIVVGKTLVVNSGAHGKFLSRLDLDVRRRCGLSLQADPGAFARRARGSGDGAADRRDPRALGARLAEPLAVSETLLYRRGNFNGSFDEVVLDALLKRATRRWRSRPASGGE